MLLTEEIFYKAMSSNGGFNRKQFETLGFEIKHGYTPEHGWKYRMIGCDFPKDVIDRFLALKDAHLAKSNIAGQKTLF